MLRYFITYKPYKVLSQFSSQDDKQTLKNYFDVGKNVYPVGRLDYDSEGLLLLTNDTNLNHRLLHPTFFHEREYWVQVDGMPAQQALQQLQQGVDITVDGEKYHTKKCTASLFETEPNVVERIPPIRFRKEIPAPWMKIILTEGKNRQVRKMTASIGFPTLRLIRYRIEKIELNDLKPGEMTELSKKIIYKKLFNE
ncbi:ribosomal large subunit pseudouridine synthase E [mine drainage metagenome]|uniref:Ribosomal large subunit pseudouridine synthase E n=1 Tax=mine drainage metagenome TaxID=410659 RepID=A0A1J5SA60_9ZZZZ